MSNKKISELTAYTTPVSGDVLPINDSTPTTKKVTVDNLFNILSSLFRVKDSTDPTKKVAFDVSGVTTGTTRTITIPDANTTMVGTDTTQTLSGKTLTSPLLNLGSDAEGDTYYRNSSGVLVRLPRGTDNYIMKMNGNVPNWEAETTISAATESQEGIGRLATSSDINSGTATESGYPLFLTPDNIAASIYKANGFLATASESITAGDALSAFYYQADGGIQYDNKATTTGSASSITYSFTVGNNSNRVLLAVLTTNSGSGADSATPSYGGIAMTQVGANQDFGGFNRTRVFRLFAPATGANNFTITFSFASTNYSLALYSYYGVSQSALDGSAQATATTVNYTPTQAGVLVFTAVTASSAPTGGSNMQLNQQTSSVTGGSYYIFSGDSGHILQANVAGTFSATGGSAINVVALAPATSPSFNYVAKSSASSTTNTIQTNKYDNFVGFALNSASAGQSVAVQTGGMFLTTGLTAFATYYLANSSGTIATSAGSNSKKVGRTISTTQLLIKQDNS